MESQLPAGTAWGQDSYVGKPQDVVTIDVRDAVVQDYIRRTDDRNPWYSDDSPFGGPVAPAMLLFGHSYRQINRWYLPTRYGNLHAKQEWAFYQPVLVGERIVASTSITDRYSKRDRDLLVSEVVITKADGVLAARSRAHQSFLRNGAGEGVVVDRERERRPGHSIKLRPGARLEEFGPCSRLVDKEACERFVGDRLNYHNDKEEARKLGFPDVVVQGTLAICLLNQLMTERFGAHWWVGGRLSVNLVNVSWVGEAITARGIVRERSLEGSRSRAHCEIWTAKDDGTITVIGSASAAEPVD